MAQKGVMAIQQSWGSEKVTQKLNEYYSLFDNNKEIGTAESEKKRKENYAVLSTHYYDIATDFYEYGWGESFHFAARHKGETIPESIARAELYVALRLGLRPGQKVLDVGCGVGGPMREIARFSGANVVGLNLNEYQLKRAQVHNKRYGMEKNCELMKGDFMNIPAENEAFDAVYEIEATPHAPSKVGVFKEIFRVLKPGGYFAGYEWCMTDKYDPSNEEHNRIKYGIELGNSLPEIATTKEVADALREAGFEVIELTDFGVPTKQNSIPWYDPLDSKMSLQGFRYTGAGRWLTGWMLAGLEFLRIAPKGSLETSTMLQNTAFALVNGGKLGIFTPSYFFLARKPAN